MQPATKNGWIKRVCVEEVIAWWSVQIADIFSDTPHPPSPALTPPSSLPARSPPRDAKLTLVGSVTAMGSFSYRCTCTDMPSCNQRASSPRSPTPSSSSSKLSICERRREQQSSHGIMHQITHARLGTL